MRLLGAVRSVRDAAHLLLLDWMSPGRRRYWEATRGFIRTMEFHAHARVPAIGLRELLRELRAEEEEVVLPAPLIETGGVGDAPYLAAIGALARAARPTHVLEFGTYLGVSTLTLALNTGPNARIVTVDLPDAPPAEGLPLLDRHDTALVRQSRGRVGQAFRGHALREKIRQVFVDSSRLDATTLVSSAELVFIDGGHTFDLVEADTNNALRVLGGRGIVLWDDYWWFYPDVVRYLDGLSGRLPLRRVEGTNLVVHTRGFGTDM